MTKYTACFGRYEIEQLSPVNNTVLISISDPDSKSPILKETATNGWDAVLRLQFWDVERLIQGYDPATDDQLKLIHKFIRSYYDKNIFAHCEAGVSRSAAVREYLLRRGWQYWGNNGGREVYPNRFVLNGLESLDYPKGYGTQTSPDPTEQKA